MKKIRLWFVGISVLVSSAILFGGWFVYHSVAMENPITDTVERISGIAEVHDIRIESDEVIAKVTLTQDAELRSIFAQVRKEGASVIKNRKFSIEIDNASSDKLDRLWGSTLFAIAQSMDQRTYAEIPVTLDNLQDQVSGLHTHYEMDEEHVYIRLNLRQDAVKYIVLPREPSTLGVWANE